MESLKCPYCGAEGIDDMGTTLSMEVDDLNEGFITTIETVWCENCHKKVRLLRLLCVLPGTKSCRENGG